MPENKKNYKIGKPPQMETEETNVMKLGIKRAVNEIIKPGHTKYDKCTRNF